MDIFLWLQTASAAFIGTLAAAFVVYGFNRICKEDRNTPIHALLSVAVPLLLAALIIRLM